MFNTSTFQNGLNLPKIINGISKGLNLANQLIPIYKQVKPNINNLKKIIQKINKSSQTNFKPLKAETNVSASNSPTFFH